ncbi:MAG TPA: hypothetical protein VFS95_06515 [Telluria sp.]|nr:hypothetical protein [Telluria sp.]
MNKWLAALALAACAPFASADSATEAEWIAAATAAVAYGQAQGMPIALEVQSGDGLSGHTPVGIWSANGRCTLVVSARDNPTAERVSAMIAPELRALFLAGAAMHEVGHCHRRLQGYPHNEKLLPVVAWIGPVESWFNRRIRLEEAYADMTEVAWLARHHPDQYAAVLQEIVKVRTRFREPKHDTLPWLALAMADGPHDDGQDLFTMADEKLSRYR